MAFNSFTFWLIYPLFFIFYWLIPSKYIEIRKWILIIGSYLLYLNWNPFYVFVLMYVTLITFWGAKICKQSKIYRNKTLISLVAIILTLAPLVLFKYYNFVNENIYATLLYFGLRFELPGLNWAIPVGISFYTFQALGYLLDIISMKMQPEKKLSDYVLFCSFFPQLLSGPISKASELLPQIKEKHIFDYQQVRSGLQLLLWGVFLKATVADRLGIYVDSVYSNYNNVNGITCFVASIFFTIQIYADFAGYSLMAVGIGKTLGFNLVNNFNRPYFSASITDFWRRWHISLTRWLTTYVYINMGGARCSKSRHYLNIMVTFLVSGLWHGANWTFVVWGVLHGLFQTIEKILGLDPKGRYKDSWAIKKIYPIRVVCTFLLVSFAWIFFRMPSISDSFNFISIMFTSGGHEISVGESSTNLALSFMAIIILFIKEFLEEYFKIDINKTVFYIRWPYYLLTFMAILLFGVLDSGQFIYVSF